MCFENVAGDMVASLFLGSWRADRRQNPPDYDKSYVALGVGVSSALAVVARAARTEAATACVPEPVWRRMLCVDAQRSRGGLRVRGCVCTGRGCVWVRRGALVGVSRHHRGAEFRLTQVCERSMLCCALRVAGGQQAAIALAPSGTDLGSWGMLHRSSRAALCF